MTRILLIEDEETCQEIALRILKRLGIADVVLARDGEEGLTLLDGMATPQDIVISSSSCPTRTALTL